MLLRWWDILQQHAKTHAISLNSCSILIGVEHRCEPSSVFIDMTHRQTGQQSIKAAGSLTLLGPSITETLEYVWLSSTVRFGEEFMHVQSQNGGQSVLRPAEFLSSEPIFQFEMLNMQIWAGPSLLSNLQRHREWRIEIREETHHKPIAIETTPPGICPV